MDTNEIRLEIKNWISKTDQKLITKLGIETFAGISGDDIDSLKKTLKKVSMFFKFHRIAAIICSAILIVSSMLKFFDLLEMVNMNKAGLLILFTIVFILAAFSYFNVKVNLENKIWLLKLLERIEKA